MKVLVVLVLAVFTGEYEEIKISLLFLERDKLSPCKIRIKKCKLRVRCPTRMYLFMAEECKDLS